jgi:DNA-binding MarR family transcriptional regulator
MATSFQDSIESLATDIRNLADQLQTDTFLQFVQTAVIINRYLDTHPAGRSASRTAFNVLNALVLNGGSMTPTQISKQILRSKHAVTRLVDTLEKKGLVKRGAIGRDRRTREVSITKKGLELNRKQGVEHQDRIISQVFAPLDEEQLSDLNFILKRLREHLLSLIPDFKS